MLNNRPQRQRTEPKKLLTVRELSDLTDYSEGYIRNLVWMGKIPKERTLGRVRFDLDKVMAAMQKRGR